jgi:hypothetical protein
MQVGPTNEAIHIDIAPKSKWFIVPLISCYVISMLMMIGVPSPIDVFGVIQIIFMTGFSIFFTYMTFIKPGMILDTNTNPKE